MVYEHISGCFILKDPSSGFSKLFRVMAIVVCGDISRLVALVVVVSRLLIMAKDIGGFPLIIMGEVFLQFISRSIALKLQGLFQEHLSPHRLGILTLGNYKAILFSIRTLFDLHLDWAVMQVDVENIFNSIS